MKVAATSPISVSQNAQVLTARLTDIPARAAAALADGRGRCVRRISTSTSRGFSLRKSMTAVASPTMMMANVMYAHSQLMSAMMVAAKGGMVMPPKLLPDTTMPVMRPIEFGNHSPTILPAGRTVAPGKPA